MIKYCDDYLIKYRTSIYNWMYIYYSPFYRLLLNTQFQVKMQKQLENSGLVLENQ